MKKLNIRITTVLFTLLIVMVSCTDLSENPYGEITQKNFNPTQKDIPRLVAPIYTPLRGFMACCYGFVTMQASASDEFLTPGRPNGWGGPYIPYHRFKWNPNHPYVTANWSTFYDGINAANRVLYQIQSGLVKPSSDKAKASLVAEIRAARAFYYYLLMDNYGNVPLVTDFQAKGLPSQSSRKEIYNFVVSELKDAIPDLPEAADQSTYGRMNKWAAKTVLADVYLNATVYLDDTPNTVENTGSPQWDKVIKQTNDIINSGKYHLTSDYHQNFSRDNQNSKEIIFAVPYDEVNAPGNTMHMRVLAPVQQQIYDMKAQPWGGSAAVPQFINSYNSNDKRLEDTWAGGPQVNSAGDTLINFKNDLDNIEQADFDQGWRLTKYEIYQGMTASSDVDLPFYRYADVLMMKAEALLRTGRASEAAQIVTKVRQRDFDDPSKATVTGAELQQGSDYNYGYWENGQVTNAQGGGDIKYGRFLDELGWEFAVEGHRRQDLIRFGVFSTKSWFNKKASVSRPCESVFPIPYPALNSNKNLKQHPCYQ